MKQIGDRNILLGVLCRLSKIIHEMHSFWHILGAPEKGYYAHYCSSDSLQTYPIRSVWLYRGFHSEREKKFTWYGIQLPISNPQKPFLAMAPQLIFLSTFSWEVPRLKTFPLPAGFPAPPQRCTPKPIQDLCWTKVPTLRSVTGHSLLPGMLTRAPGLQQALGWLQRPRWLPVGCSYMQPCQEPDRQDIKCRQGWGSNLISSWQMLCDVLGLPSHPPPPLSSHLPTGRLKMSHQANTKLSVRKGKTFTKH